MQRLNYKEAKPQQINFLISSDLKDKLDRIAGEKGKSAYIRSLIERAWEEQTDKKKGATK